jgi:peptidyl-prolyl cis-trans isomerase C
VKSFLYAKIENLVRLTILLATCSLVAAATNTDPPKPDAPAETTADSIAVTINGVDILESQIEIEVKSQLKRMAKQVPPTFAEQYKKQLRQQTLEKIIIEELLDQMVKAEKIVVTDEDVTNQLREVASQQQPSLSLEDFKALIEAHGQSLDQVKQQIRKGLGYQKLMQAQFADRMNVTEDDARKYYSENKKAFETPKQVRASHILIKPDTTDTGADTNEAKAKAKAKAEDLRRQIKSGAAFAELAKANSSCPSSAKGGDLGFFGKGQMVPAFEKAAFELNVGQVSDIVETQFGYHIIKVTDRKDAGVTTFEQAKDDLIASLKATKQSKLAKEYIGSLKAKAKIVYPPGKEPKTPPSPPIMAPSRPRPTPQPKER